MNDESNPIGYIWVCLDDVPHNFESIGPYEAFKENSTFGIKDIFLYLANMWMQVENRRALEASIQKWCSNSNSDNPDIDPLKNNLASIIESQFIKMFVSYICAFFIDGKSADEIHANIETACMIANHFASYLCAPKQIRPSGMENRDVVTAVIGSLDDVGAAFKLHYRPVMGYCGEKFTYLNSAIFQDMISIVNMAALSILKDDSVVRKCQNCGEYFIPTSRSDEIYCDKVLPNGKTCKTVGYDERIKRDDVLREYRKIYKTQNARKQRNSHKRDISDKFQKWVTFAKKQVSKCQSGEISLDEMVSLISSNDWMK